MRISLQYGCFKCCGRLQHSSGSFRLRGSAKENKKWNAIYRDLQRGVKLVVSCDLCVMKSTGVTFNYAALNTRMFKPGIGNFSSRDSMKVYSGVATRFGLELIKCDCFIWPFMTLEFVAWPPATHSIILKEASLWILKINCQHTYRAVFLLMSSRGPWTVPKQRS